MVKKIIKFFYKKEKKVEEKKQTEKSVPRGIFSTDISQDLFYRKQISLSDIHERCFPVKAPVPVDKDGNAFAMDGLNAAFQLSQPNAPIALLDWYSRQGFIGYQFAAILAQHWLVDKACTTPAKDAIRKGYEITVNDGIEVSEEILDALRQADVNYRLNENMVQFVRFGRIYGIRIALFLVDSNDPKYYEKPFNIDGVKKGSYRGISQVDPYWITPELDAEASANPASIYFYEPTWWRVNAVRIHRSHLIIMKTSEVADVLKPSYFYGGVPIPQKIYERVYAAERTANEAPQLAMTKRTDVLQIDIDQALAHQGDFETKIEQWVFNRDNYGIKTIGLTEDMKQFDTSLADLDAVIMTQYQIVAAAANVPIVKLMGTSPKGFNAAGTYEEASYHEELESIQAHDLTPLLQRHHLLVIKSEIAPRFGIETFSTCIHWHALNSLTAKEEAEIKKMSADTDAVLASIGAIDGMDSRQRLISDPDSGYNGLSIEDENEEIELDFSNEVENDPEEKEI